VRWRLGTAPLGDTDAHMQISKLTCPYCQSPYPLWRVIVRFRTHVCPTCKSKLEFTRASSQRLGTIVGIAAVFWGFVLGPIVGADTLGWPYWVFLALFSYIPVRTVMALVGRFAPYDQVRPKAKRWQLFDFDRVSRRHRTFLLLGYTVLPACGLALGWLSLPIWLVPIVVLIETVVSVLFTIGSWHLLFGKRGVWTRWESDVLPGNSARQ
jgi:hypothetical protein